MCAAFWIFVVAIVVMIVVADDIVIDIHRCADIKAEQKKDLLAILVFVSSGSTEFDQRSELRRTNFQDAKLLLSRDVYRPFATPTGGTISNNALMDHRPVCVQPVFVLSPWVDQYHWTHVVNQYQWYQISEEHKKHRDILIAPTIVNHRTQARELMYVLEWATQTAPWADYVVSIDAEVRINWKRMVELFPPPVPRASSGHALWHLGTSELGMEALFSKDPRDGARRQCADTRVAAFSRDLVHQMTSMPFSTQILYALSHPFSMYQSRCKLGPRGVINLAKWVMISGTYACEKNDEEIFPFYGLSSPSFGFCKTLCVSKPECGAIDWFRSSGWCNLYRRACKKPQRLKAASSSYRLVRPHFSQPSDDKAGKPSENPSKNPSDISETITMEWVIIDDTHACERSFEKNIVRFASTHVDNLHDCQARCQRYPKCRAIDYFAETKWCNLYRRPCSSPLEAKDAASSYQLYKHGKQIKILGAPSPTDKLVEIPADAINGGEVLHKTRACEQNKEKIKPYHYLVIGNRELCRTLCLSHSQCRAIDWFPETNWCNLYDQVCTTPLMTKDGASSFKINREQCIQAGSGGGMMGILGNRDKYVCNAVQAVLGHLANVSKMTFHTTLVSKSDHRFWQIGNGTNASQSGKKYRRASEQSSFRRNGKDRAKAQTIRKRQRSSEHHHLRRPQQEPNRPGPRLERRRMSEQSNSHTEKEQASAIRARDHKSLADARRRESFRRSRRRAPGVAKARQYTVPTNYRPGKRCAAAKRELGDDLLTVVALVPGSPFGFKRRNLMRKYLSGPAHKMRSREFYRKVLTLSVPKIQPLFEFYIARNANLQDDFKGVNHTNYTKYKWGWFSKMLDKPMLDPRALCIEVIFAVGLPLAPWAPGEAEKLTRLSREVEEYNDILIGPYLDGRGKGKAMTQKTIYLLWWSTFHLSYADHVYKVDTDTFVNFTALVQVLPPPSKNPSLQWVGHLHGRYWTEGLGPACGNGELYGFSQPLLQLLRPLIETPAHVEFFLRNPVHVIATHEGKMTDPIPYGLRFPEDFVACSLVTQAAIGHEDRFEDKILEGPDYFPMWVHHLKRNRSYVACATGVNCTGEPNYRNTMPSLDDLVLPHL